MVRNTIMEPHWALPLVSQRRRLYLDLVNETVTTVPTILGLRDSKESLILVVELCSIRTLAADYQLLRSLGFNHASSQSILSTFVTITLELVSSLRCG